MTYVKTINLNRNPLTGELTERGLEESVINYENSRPVDNGQYKAFSFLESKGRPTRMSLQEAFLANPDAANLLRQDLRFLAFDMFEQMPRSFDRFVVMEDSTKKQEEYLRDANPGVLPQVASGTPTPVITGDFEGGVIIKNYRYAGIGEVTGDMLMFDEIGKIRQIGRSLGRSARMTEENAVYSAIATTTNYTRNSTTNDNTVGANQQTLTFNMKALNDAMAVISTSRDRISGAYLGYKANTIICSPLMENYVKQVLMSPLTTRAHGVTTAEVFGQGNMNPLQGAIDQIIVSPWLGTSYQWALCDTNAMGLVYQTVKPFTVEEEAQAMTSEAYLTKDVIRYLVQGYFGVGFVDDRAWFYSDSTTEPTVE